MLLLLLVVTLLVPIPGSAQDDTSPVPAATTRSSRIEEEILIPVEAGQLSGTLTRPAATNGPTPAVMLLVGSGQTDRDGNNPLIEGRIDSFKIIAGALAEAGVIALRFDKRGAGKTPNWTSAPTQEQLVADVVAAYRFLGEQPGVDPQRVIMAGHSEGGLLSVLALRHVQPAALVLLEAPSRPMIEVMRTQLQDQIPADPGWVEAGCLEYGLGLVDAIEAGGELPAVPKGLPEPWNGVFKAMVDNPEVRVRLQNLGMVDPSAEMANSRYGGPVLLLYGDRDDQIPPPEGQRLADAMRKSGNDNVELVIVPGMDHVLKEVLGEEPEAYGAPGRKVPSQLLERFSSWVLESAPAISASSP